MKINGKEYLSPQEQLFENTKDIEKLKQLVKPVYQTTATLTSSSVSVALSDTNIGDATEGWLMTNDGLLFKITANDGTTVLLMYYSDFKGPQGESGADDIDDNSSGNDDKVYSQAYIGNIINNGIWYSETQPSGSPLVINITSIVMNLRDNPNCQNTIQQGDMFFYVDGEGKAKELYKIDNITSGVATVEKVCDIGGGKQLYQHNIRMHTSNLAITITITNNDNTPFTKSSINTWLSDKGFTGASPDYETYNLGFVYSTGNDKLVSQGIASRSGTTFTYKNIVGSYTGINDGDILFDSDKVIPL